MKRQTLIWMDNRVAEIFHLEGEKIVEQIINSEVEEYNVTGGARSKAPWGPMDVVSESKMKERKRQQFSQYYKSISEVVADSDEVVIIGPAEAKIGLKKFMEADTNLQHKIKEVVSKDSMTTNQKRAMLGEFFAA